MLSVSLVSQAIVIRHDKADSRYRVDESDYPQIFFLHTRYGNKICAATLISPRWAITAAHCTDQTPIKETLDSAEFYALNVAGRPHKIVGMQVHPGYQDLDQSKAVDLALLELDRNVIDVEPVDLYLQNDEKGQVVSLLGWGFTGIGNQDRKNNDGKFRRAQNTVVEVGQWLRLYFDDPRQREDSALSLEGVPGLGDSGGPALVEDDGKLKIIGVALGELKNINNPEVRQGRYGATELYERISSHLDWIRSVISNTGDL